MPSLTQIVRRRPADVLLAVEAFVLLAGFRVGLMFVPVKRIIGTLTRGNAATEIQAGEGVVTEEALTTALRVRWAVEAVTRNSPAEFVCFPQTLAGYTMLRRRGVASTMVYGVARSPEGKLIAHTWLLVGERSVVGGEGSAAFSEIERWS